MSSIKLLGFFSIVILSSVLWVEAQQDEEIGAANWPWEKPHTFKCPSMFGTFSDPDDCASYFMCVARKATRKTCKRMMLFDKYKKKCVNFFIAVCDNSGKESKTTKEPVVGTTPVDDKFTCPGLSGSHLHPTDCTKYYTCTFFIPFLKTCPDTELFDGVKKQCRPAKEVHCGSRIRPTDPTSLTDTTPTITATMVKETTTPITTETIAEETTTPTTTETIVEETTTPTTTETIAEETTTETMPEETTTPTTTEALIPTTTAKTRVTAPDTDCDEDDLDCIIDDLGENPIWFVCESDMGSYPHPTSRKLFIFCLNWKPSVKKCGQDLVFSEDLMTCVSP